MREHLATFLARAREESEHGFGLPRFVERELGRYLACGILAHGFARVRCGECGHVYDVRRLGVDFVASPRHADGVVVTGPGRPGRRYEERGDIFFDPLLYAKNRST